MSTKLVTFWLVEPVRAQYIQQTSEEDKSVAFWVKTNLSVLQPAVKMKFLHLRSKRRMSETDFQTLSTFGIKNQDVIIMVLDDLSDEAALQLAKLHGVPKSRHRLPMLEFFARHVVELIIAVIAGVIVGVLLWYFRFI